MFSHKHYVPILKGKKGEFWALKELEPNIRPKFTPFFDIPRPEDRWKSRFDEYLSNKAIDMRRYWGIDRPVFVDYYDIGLDKRTSKKMHYVKYSFDRMRQEGVIAIPVTGLDRDTAYNQAVAQTIKADGRGVLFRLLREDIENIQASSVELKSLLSDLKAKESESHLLLDIRHLEETEISDRLSDVIDFLKNFKGIDKWKSVILAASGFPEHMGGVSTHSIEEIPRNEIVLWEKVLRQAKKKGIQPLPVYSDYGICNPEILDFDLRMNPSANIRYTLEKTWLIVKGGGTKKKINGRMSRDFKQFYNLAQQLRTNAKFYPPQFSFGDWYIQNCRIGSKGPGNLTTWRKIGTNHHLTLVANQIANSRVI